MYEKFQNKTSPSLIVEAILYKEDGSNQSEVVTFLVSRTKHRSVSTSSLDKLITFRRAVSTFNEERIHPGSMVIAYPDRTCGFMGKSLFPHYFHPLPAGGHYIATTPPLPHDALLVEAYYYLPDESNTRDVLAFLDDRLNAAATHTTTTNQRTGKKLPAIGAVKKHDEGRSTHYVYPGQVVLTYGASGNKDVTVCSLEDFHKNYIPVTVHQFEKDTKPVYPEVQTYRNLNDGTDRPKTVYAMQFVPERNYTSLRDMLAPYGATLLHYHDYTVMYVPAKKHIEIYNAAQVPFDSLAIRPNQWVTLTMRDGQLPLYCMYNDVDFHTTFTPHDFTTKDTMPTRLTAPAESEFQKNRAKVFDVLAILRKDPRETEFELAARDILDLLADAYNEGFEVGLTTGETNPYQDWE